MPIVIGNLKRLELLRSKPELKAKLWENVNKLQEGFRSRGFDLGNTNSPVTPVFLKVSIPETINLVVDLRENHGIFCSAVTYPVIPKGMLMLRIIPTSSHSDEEIRLTLEAFEAIREKIESGVYLQQELAKV
jgi:glycine C-acetyltransferase